MAVDDWLVNTALSETAPSLEEDISRGALGAEPDC